MTWLKRTEREVRVREREVGNSEGCRADVYLRHTYVAERSARIRAVRKRNDAAFWRIGE